MRIRRTLDIVLEADSFSEALDQIDYLDSIAAQDRRVVAARDGSS